MAAIVSLTVHIKDADRKDGREVHHNSIIPLKCHSAIILIELTIKELNLPSYLDECTLFFHTFTLSGVEVNKSDSYLRHCMSNQSLIYYCRSCWL